MTKQHLDDADVDAALQQVRGEAVPQHVQEMLKTLPVNLDEAPYVDTLWNPHQKTINTRRAGLCRDILLYMLGRGKKVQELKERYARALEVPADEVELPEKL